MTIDRHELGAAWGEFLADFGGQHAVTLSYNNHVVGTASPCYRVTPDGKCLRLRGSGVAARQGINRVSGARAISLERVHADLDRLHGRVDRKLLGSHFNRLPADQRSAFVGFVEHLTSNAHVHLTWRAPATRAEEFITVITEAWLATGPSATIDVQSIRDGGWGHYVAKHQYGSADAALFVASRAARK